MASVAATESRNCSVAVRGGSVTRIVAQPPAATETQISGSVKRMELLRRRGIFIRSDDRAESMPGRTLRGRMQTDNGWREKSGRAGNLRHAIDRSAQA